MCPAENRLGEEGKGYKIAFLTLSPGASACRTGRSPRWTIFWELAERLRPDEHPKKVKIAAHEFVS